MTKFNKKIKKMPDKDLNKALIELRQELLFDNTHISQDGKPTRKEDTGKMSYKKRNIARILTEIEARKHG